MAEFRQQFQRCYINKVEILFWLHENKQNPPEDSMKASTDLHESRTLLTVLIMAS